MSANESLVWNPLWDEELKMWMKLWREEDRARDYIWDDEKLGLYKRFPSGGRWTDERRNDFLAGEYADAQDQGGIVASFLGWCHAQSMSFDAAVDLAWEGARHFVNRKNPWERKHVEAKARSLWRKPAGKTPVRISPALEEWAKRHGSK